MINTVPPAVKAHLRQDPRLAPLVDTLDIPPRPDHGDDVYFGLIRAIVYQQLSGKAAATIFGRFLHLFPDEYPTPELLLQADETAIRAAGMSRGKTAYVRNVAEYWVANRLQDANWEDYSDEELVDMLTSIKGVGRWTVEMMLMFVLKRPDLLPLDDLVVRRNLMTLCDVDPELKGKKLKAACTAAAEGWRPYRSWASRYLWAWAGTEV